MHAILLTAAFVLAGQVAGASGTRYGNVTPSGGSSTNAQGQAPGQAWSNDSQPLRSTQQSVLPQQPGQPNSTLPASPADYRSRGQQAPASLYPADRGDTSSPTTTLQSNSLTSESSAQPKLKPSQLIGKLLKPPTNNQLVGVPYSLAAVVEGARSRSEQTQRIEAYWDLSASVAGYYLTLREATDLGTLRQSVLRPSPQWEQARESLDQRVEVARRSAQAAQVRLQRMLGQTGESNLPLPSDAPHCGNYDTRYKEIFAARLPSPEANRLHELLPLEHQDLRNQTAGVVAAHEWLNTVSQRRDPQTDGSGLLRALELLSLRREAFVEAVKYYNKSIARYSEIASPGNVGTGRLVAMLIYTSDSQGTAWNRRGIRRTSAEEALGSATSGSSPPQTFADEADWNQTQRVETLSEGAERSILKRPAGK